MRRLATAIATLSLIASPMAQAQDAKMQEDVGMATPALEKYRQGTPFADVWKRPGLSARDRNIATLATLIARNQTIEMAFYFTLRSIRREA